MAKISPIHLLLISDSDLGLFIIHMKINELACIFFATLKRN